jgi:uncharacterized membrane protein
MARHPRWVLRVFSADDLQALAEAVAGAERTTSGEIRVHLEARLPRSAARGDALARARQVFADLGMHRTAQRHGVLVYLALADHRLAVVGDEGIHARVGDGYWVRLRDRLVERLREGDPRQALLEAIAEVGRVLRQHFPRGPDDVNELNNEVSVS